MNNLVKIIAFSLSFIFFWILTVNAWIDWLDTVDGVSNITDHSIIDIENNADISTSIKNEWIKVLTLIKYLVSWLLLIYMVYVGIQMIVSMWSDEEALSSSKRQIWYTMVWLAFINIPWEIYNAFKSDHSWVIDWSINSTWSSEISSATKNLFINTNSFDMTVNRWIVSFIEVTIFGLAVIMIVISGLTIISSAWKDEDLKEEKNKIMWSLIWLVFIWFIEAWQRFVYNWNISDWATIFETFEKLILFFAWPVAIFFLTLAWYYYITSDWDDEKVKKAKSIILNTIIATVILLASHVFLQDLIKIW